jgi:hypothetical protein
VNAWLCFVELPVAVDGNPVFHWHVIPAGAAHGAILAASTFGMAETVKNRGVVVRLALAAPLAWLAGYGSWVPLNRSVFGESWPESVVWPFENVSLKTFYEPFSVFGLVALLYYLCLCFRRNRNGLGTHLLIAVASGILGSLWWWIAVQPWVLSLVHGTIWGLLVGFGAWKASAAARLGAYD